VGEELLTAEELLATEAVLGESLTLYEAGRRSASRHEALGHRAHRRPSGRATASDSSRGAGSSGLTVSRAGGEEQE
jgi:hypothetical protein